MYKIINVEQNSQEWHDLREENYKTASRTPIVCGVSPFQTKEQLAMQLRGEYEPFYSKAMQLGNQLEDEVRLLAEAKLNDTFMPLVGIKDNFLASLDGINFERDTIIEIKVSEKTFNDIKNNNLPDVYVYQIQHQMMVFDTVDQAYLVAYNPKTKELAISKPILPAGAYIMEIQHKWQEFDNEKDTLTVKEFDLSDNAKYLEAVEEFKRYKLQHDKAKEQLDKAKDKLYGFYGGGKTFGGGVTISYAKASKTINYSNIYKDNKDLLKDVELDKYTSEKKGSFRVTAK